MISPSDHEKADTRTLLHAVHMKHQGMDSIILRPNDTAVLILVIFSQAQLGFKEFWLSYNTGTSHKYIPVHEIVCEVGRSTALAVPGSMPSLDVTITSQSIERARKPTGICSSCTLNLQLPSVFCLK